MRNEFDHELTCRIFRSDVGDFAQVLRRAADWIERQNVAVQDITSAENEDDVALAIYYIRKAEHAP
jgi:hypothetical protein